MIFIMYINVFVVKTKDTIKHFKFVIKKFTYCYKVIPDIVIDIGNIHKANDTYQLPQK